VAEDNPINQKVLTTLLAKAGHHSWLAADGKQALAALRVQVFDLVLMDVQMPELDGLEATRRIRAAEAGTRAHMPVVGVTAGAIGSELEKCLAAGMDAVLTKPISLEQLQNVLARVADGKPLSSRRARAGG
jgi:CheY-like chemotaxis protein